MYCKKCGHEILEGTRFCTACGTKTDIEAGMIADKLKESAKKFSDEYETKIAGNGGKIAKKVKESAKQMADSCGTKIEGGSKTILHKVKENVKKVPELWGKHKKIILLVPVAVIFLFVSINLFKYFTRPFTKLEKAFKQGPIEVNAIYSQLEDEKEKQKAIDKAIKYIEDLENNYYETSTISGEDCIEEIKELGSGILASEKDRVDWTMYRIKEIADSRSSYENAFDCSDLETRIRFLKEVSEKDVLNYNSAQEYIAEYTQSIVVDVIENAKGLAAKDMYSDALNLIDETLDRFPENEDLIEYKDLVYRLEETYYVGLCREEVQNAIYNNNYYDIFYYIRDIRENYPLNYHLSELEKNAQEAFYKYYNTQIKEYESEKNYFALESLLEEMIGCYGDDNDLYQKLEYYRSLKPRLITDVEIYKSKFSEDFFFGSYSISTDKMRTDTYNNEYDADSTVGLVCGHDAGDYEKKRGGMLTFINEGFIKLTGTLAYDKDGSKGGAVSFSIYADDELVFYSGIITENTAPFSFEADIADAHMIDLFWATMKEGEIQAWGATGDGKGTIILSNPMFHKY
ncbi:MAG: NPCBM/NEW2 domain-containing protein [Lachnospiraceae bacterium]|nr:NPCBM/NEW2 domain-containing protein [Lachnospiraceae bacterium]